MTSYLLDARPLNPTPQRYPFAHIICSAVETYFKKGWIEYTKPYLGGYKEMWVWSFTE